MHERAEFIGIRQNIFFRPLFLHKFFTLKVCAGYPNIKNIGGINKIKRKRSKKGFQLFIKAGYN